MGGQSEGERLNVAEEQVIIREVRRVAQEVYGAESCHQVNLRREENTLFISAHCAMLGAMPIQQAHAIAEDMERRLRATIPHLGRVVIHVEPVESDRHADQSSEAMTRECHSSCP
jgi:divalent metal cation (Fe/Co/Zn/Cd) transporter